jgi:ligand-binding sensor domain-containing protein/signal transduction histidine kinase
VRLRPWTACIALLLWGEPALALDPRQDFSQYVQRRWTSDEGLPQNAVQSIAQTPDGYLWAATQEGVVRFDGLSFRTFDRQNTPELKSSFISVIHADPAGALWIGTGGGGLTRYAGGRFRTFTVEDGLPSNIITALAADAGGALWVGTESGAARFSEGKFTVARVGDAPLERPVTALLASPDGALWVATEAGIHQRGQDGRWTLYGTAQEPLPGRALSLLRDRGGQLWVGTDNGRLVLLSQGHFTQFGPAQGLVAERIHTLREDQDGNLWIGTSGGLYRRNGERFEAMGHEAEPVVSLFEDAEGSLWVGTDGGGLLQLRSARLRVYTTSQGLPKNNVLSLHEDAQGALWVGTYGGGLARMRGEAGVEHWSAKEGLPSEEVTAIHSDAQGSVWVGLMRRGLVRLEGGRVRLEEALSPLASASILSLRVDRAGRLWIGTLRQGLYALERGTLRHYGKAEGLADETVYALEESRDGSLWVGTRRGLSRLREGSFVSDPVIEPLAEAAVLSLHEDEAGALWVGTYSRGLHLLHEGRHFAFTSRHGLFNETIFHILEDDAQALWMSCNKGIFSVSKEQLHAVVQGRAATVVSTVFGKGDGLRNTEGNGGNQPGAWKARDGRLWFPTVGGAVAIDPRGARAQRNRFPPQVHLEEAWGDGSQLETHGLARVSPGRGRLEFRYGGVSFISPEKLTFRYRLDGFDTEWIEAGTRRGAQYTNLPPREYRFRVMAANSDGLWSEHEASVAVLLEPHFHQTAWFRALVVLAVGALGLGLHRVRVQKLQAQSAVLAERNRLAREIHDGLTQSLTGVLMQIDAGLGYLAETPEKTREHLERARDWARHSLAEARQAIWALRPSVPSVAVLAAGLRRSATLLTEEGQVQVEVRAADDRPIPPDMGAMLLRIGQEAITNAVRHGRPRHLWIDVGHTPGELRLCLRDDGRGFDSRATLGTGGGLGLVGMRERAESLGGQLNVESSPGQGTTVSAVVPLHRRGVEREHGA